MPGRLTRGQTCLYVLSLIRETTAPVSTCICKGVPFTINNCSRGIQALLIYELYKAYVSVFFPSKSFLLLCSSECPLLRVPLLPPDLHGCNKLEPNDLVCHTCNKPDFTASQTPYAYRQSDALCLPPQRKLCPGGRSIAGSTLCTG